MDAPSVARDLLAGVGRRLAHSAAVAAQVGTVAHLVEGPWSAALVDAGWLHDVGYAPALAATGFHPLDGARWLSAHGWPESVCRLVAWHTRAGQEAELRGVMAQLTGEFEPPPPAAQSALTWADLTSSPTGERCTVEERIDEILVRYPAGSVVHEATALNRLALVDTARQIETQLSRNTEVSR